MYKKYLFIVFGVMVISFVNSQNIGISELTTVCERSKPNYNECFKEKVNNLRPKLAVGQPDFNIAALEPFEWNRLILADAQNPVSGMSFYVKDLKIYKASTFHVDDIDVNFDTGITKVKLSIPSLDVTGKFKIFGTFIVLPVEIYGDISIKLYGVKSDCRTLTTKVEVEPGYTITRLSSMNIKVDSDRFQLTLRPKYPSQTFLVQQIEQRVNADFKNMGRQINFRLEQQLAKILRTGINRVLETWSYDTLFPL